MNAYRTLDPVCRSGWPATLALEYCSANDGGIHHVHLKKLLETLSSLLDNLVRKPVRKHLSGERRDRDSSRLAFQDITKVLKIAVSSADARLFELERRDVCLALGLNMALR